MDIRYSTNPNDVKRYTTEELRKEFLITNLYQPDTVQAVYSHVDRMVVLGIMPVNEELPIDKGIDIWANFGTSYFLERREAGVFNLGGLVKWRDEKAMHEVTDRYISELAIKCTGSKQKARELSGGNQQKVCLAKAFALEPSFLFVSEPTRGIDIGAKALVLDALKKFNRESGVTVVMISSELEELRQICDRIAIISGGRVAGIRPASDPSEEFGLLMVSMVK